MTKWNFEIRSSLINKYSLVYDRDGKLKYFKGIIILLVAAWVMKQRKQIIFQFNSTNLLNSTLRILSSMDYCEERFQWKQDSFLSTVIW